MTTHIPRLFRLGWIAPMLVCLGPLIICTAARAAADAPGAADETKASLVTIQVREIRLGEALKRLQDQTENPIKDLRAPIGAEEADRVFDLDLKDVPFFEALDEVARRAGVGWTPHVGDGSIGIVAENPPSKDFVAYSGPFRFELKRFTTWRDYRDEAAMASVGFEASWEPRLRPMLLSLKAESVEIRDDQGRSARPRVPAEVSEYFLRPEHPSKEFSVNLEAPKRSAKTLARIQARADVTMPAEMRTFQFPSIAKSNVELKQGEVEARLVSAEVDEHIWRVTVDLNYPKGELELQSFQLGLIQNRIHLLKGDGSRVELNGGFSTTQVGGGRLRFEYLFLGVTGDREDYQLVLEAPGRIVVVPLEFEFQNVPLP